MTTQQGDLSLLADPVAQMLLRSKLPLHLAYTWTDGTPRVVPIGFHWNGREIVVCGPPDAPKMTALRDGMKVAATIDTTSKPYKVLEIRGTVRIEVVDGVPPEYEATTIRVDGEEAGRTWLATIANLCPQMGRIFITPEWAAVLDFETRFPNALERAMERAGGF
jgi:hypothetical protein